MAKKHNEPRDIKISLEKGGMFVGLSEENIENIAMVASETAARVAFNIIGEECIKNIPSETAKRLKNVDPLLDDRDKDIHMILPENTVKNADMWQLCYVAKEYKESGLADRRIEKNIKSNKKNVDVYFYGSKWMPGEVEALLKSDTVKKTAKLITGDKYGDIFEMCGHQMHIVKRFCPCCLNIHYNIYLWGVFMIYEDTLNSFLLPLTDFVADVYSVPNVLETIITESDTEIDEFYRAVIQISFENEIVETFSEDDIIEMYNYEIVKHEQMQKIKKQQEENLKSNNEEDKSGHEECPKK